MCGENLQLKKLKSKLAIMGIDCNITINGVIAWDTDSRKAWIFDINGEKLCKYENACVMRQTNHGYALIDIRSGNAVKLYSLRNKREIFEIKANLSRTRWGIKSYDTLILEDGKIKVLDVDGMEIDPWVIYR